MTELVKLRADLGHYDVIRRLTAVSSSYLEVGVREGGSLRAALEGQTIERLFLCDTWGSESGGTGRGNHDHIVDLLADLHYTRSVEFLDVSSQSVDWDSRAGGWWDVVNIDGGHEYHEALSDMQNLWPLTRHHMVVHDIQFASVWKAVLEFCVERSDAMAQCMFGDTGTLVLTRCKER